MKRRAAPLLAAVAWSLSVVTVGAALVTIHSPATGLDGDPPIRYLPGLDAGPAQTGFYVPSYELAGDGSRLQATIRAVPEARMFIDSFARLDNQVPRGLLVTLAADGIESDWVKSYTMHVEDSQGSPLATLDLKEESPRATFVAPADGALEPLHLALAVTLESGTTDAHLGGGLTTSVSLLAAEVSPLTPGAIEGTTTRLGDASHLGIT